MQPPQPIPPHVVVVSMREERGSNKKYLLFFLLLYDIILWPRLAVCVRGYRRKRDEGGGL